MNVVVFIRRRKMAVLLPFVLCLAASLALVATIKSVYESSATILIERQVSASDLARGALGTPLEDRFQAITKMVLSRKNIAGLIEHLDLYPELQGEVSSQRLVDKMLSDISIHQLKEREGMVSMGKLPSNSLTFSLGFRGTDPQVTADVVQRLVDLLMMESMKTRESKVLSRYNFLSEQLDAVQRDIAQTEERISRFKEQNLLSLPELMNVNMKALDDLQREIDIKRIQLTSARDRVIYMEGQLRGISPNLKPFMSANGKILAMEDQLEALRSQYLNMKATHSDKHPDLIRLRRQIEALEEASGVSGRLSGLYDRLEQKESERRVLAERLSAEHPDIQAMDRDIAGVKREIEALSSGGGKAAPGPGQRSDPDNPAFIEMLTRVESARLEVASLERSIADLEAKQDDYQKRIEQMPQVEQEYINLERKYQYLQTQHKELYARQQSAKEAIDLELQQISETITMLEPPFVPEKPIKPNRPVLAVLGLLFAIGVGLGTGVAVEYMDHSMHTAQELAELSGVSVLGVIPCMGGAGRCAGTSLWRRWRGTK